MEPPLFTQSPSEKPSVKHNPIELTSPPEQCSILPVFTTQPEEGNAVSILPEIATVEFLTRCTHCGADAPVNGPSPVVVCPHCGDKTEVSEDAWLRLLSDVYSIQTRYGVGVTKRRTMETGFQRSSWICWRTVPSCPDCGEPSFLLEDGIQIACPSCGRRKQLEPAPEWLKSISGTVTSTSLADDVSRAQAEIAENSAKCSICGAALSFESASSSAVCDYCGATNAIPQKLRTGVNREPWLICSLISDDPRTRLPLIPKHPKLEQFRNSGVISTVLTFLIFAVAMTFTLTAAWSYLSKSFGFFGQENGVSLTVLATFFAVAGIASLTGWLYRLEDRKKWREANEEHLQNAHQHASKLDLCSPQNEVIGRIIKVDPAKPGDRLAVVKVQLESAGGAIIKTADVSLEQKTVTRLGGVGGTVRMWYSAKTDSLHCGEHPSVLSRCGTAGLEHRTMEHLEPEYRSPPSFLRHAAVAAVAWSGFAAVVLHGLQTARGWSPPDLSSGQYYGKTSAQLEHMDELLDEALDDHVMNPTGAAPEPPKPEPVEIVWTGRVRKTDDKDLRKKQECRLTATVLDMKVRRVHLTCGDKNLFDTDAIDSFWELSEMLVEESDTQRVSHHYGLTLRAVDNERGSLAVDIADSNYKNREIYWQAPLYITSARIEVDSYYSSTGRERSLQDTTSKLQTEAHIKLTPEQNKGFSFLKAGDCDLLVRTRMATFSKYALKHHCLLSMTCGKKELYVKRTDAVKIGFRLSPKDKKYKWGLPLAECQISDFGLEMLKIQASWDNPWLGLLPDKKKFYMMNTDFESDSTARALLKIID